MSHPASDNQPRPRRRVLVVDSCSKTAKFIGAELAGRGFEVLMACTVEEATLIIVKPESRPDLVLLDIDMPRVNGAQLCRFIKSNQQFCGIKVILYSGADQQKLKDIADSCGADGHTPKETLLGHRKQKTR